MPMTPPGRHHQADSQISVAPIGAAAEPVPVPSIVAPVGMPASQMPAPQQAPAANTAPDDIYKRLAE